MDDGRQPDQSAALRDRLLGEISGLRSAENAASWARDGIIAKNSLAAADAKLVEEAWDAWRAEVDFATRFVAEAPSLDITGDDPSNQHGSGGGSMSLREVLVAGAFVRHTAGRGTEQLGYTFGLIDLLPYGRQEEWQDSPEGWPQSPAARRSTKRSS